MNILKITYFFELPIPSLTIRKHYDGYMRLWPFLAIFPTTHHPVALWFSAPALKNYAPRSFLIFFLCMKNKKECPNLYSMRLERALLSYIWVCHGCCDKSGKNVIFV